MAERGSRHHAADARSEEHTSELQSQSNLVCRLLLEKKKTRSLGKTRLASSSSPCPRPTEIYTLSLHDALPICRVRLDPGLGRERAEIGARARRPWASCQLQP